MKIKQLVLCGFFSAVPLSLAQSLFAIRADVNLVQLQVRVTDSRGHAVSGLSKEAFRLLVDDVPQPITVFQGEDAPVTAGIVVDNSASMAPKREEVIAAALAFARASNPKDQMFVVHFNERSRLGLPAGKLFTGDVSELETAIAAFDLGGTTAFYDAVLAAQSHFDQAAYTRRVLLTITDGGDNSSHATLDKALDAVRRSGIVIYPIGVFDETDHDRNPAVLSEMARQTSGEAFFPAQISDISKICVGIAQEIRNEYTLGFEGVEDGQYHRIRLTVDDSKLGPLEVHTRPGYVAAKAPSAGAEEHI